MLFGVRKNLVFQDDVFVRSRGMFISLYEFNVDHKFTIPAPSKFTTKTLHSLWATQVKHRIYIDLHVHERKQNFI